MMKTANSNKRIIDLTLGELLDEVEARVRAMQGKQPESGTQEKPKRYVYGLKGLQKLLGCSKTTASRLKQSGKIDEAITQVGAIIIIDADKALELAKKGNKKEPKNKQ